MKQSNHTFLLFGQPQLVDRHHIIVFCGATIVWHSAWERQKLAHDVLAFYWLKPPHVDWHHHFGEAHKNLVDIQ